MHLNSIIINASIEKKWASLKLFSVCLMVCVVAGISQGQDANWDLKNYHYYVAHVWVHDRYDVDIAPAQIQTWHHPYADLPYYWMAKWNFNSIIITGFLSIPAGVCVYFLLLIARQLSSAFTTNFGTGYLLLLSVTGAAGARNIGTTMSEWHLCALILAAMLCLMRVETNTKLQLKLFFVAGLLGGMAVGLKLTSAPFAIGLAAMCMCLPCSFSKRFKGLLLLALGGAIGTTLLLGPWAWAQYERYGNPLFPYFNNIFKSPLLVESAFRDTRFGIKSALDIVSLPLRLTWNSTFLVSEVVMRDPRLLFASVGMLVLLWPVEPIKAKRSYFASAWIPPIVFFITSYLCWVVFFGIYRYIVPLELLAGIFILAIATMLKPKPMRVLLVTITLLVVAMTRTPSWGRADHGAVAVQAQIPTLPPNAMIVIASLQPISYVVPSLPQSVRTIAVFNNFMHAGPPSILQQHAINTIRAHEGPLFQLLNETIPSERHYDNQLMDDLLINIGFKTQFGNCLPIVTKMEPRALALCPIERIQK